MSWVRLRESLHCISFGPHCFFTMLTTTATLTTTPQQFITNENQRSECSPGITRIPANVPESVGVQVLGTFAGILDLHNFCYAPASDDVDTDESDINRIALSFS